MPITTFQAEVLGLLKKHRNPNSYVAGGIAIHRAPGSKRYSNDVDFFHDLDEAVTSSFQMDCSILKEHGFQIKTVIQQPSFYRAVLSKGDKSLKLEWVRDTAFRFFPVVEDELLGFRMHDVDLMINKCLALVNRIQVRDIVDLIQLQADILEVAHACFACPGKDPGLTPTLVLEMMRRNSLIDPIQLAAETLEPEITAVELKTQWIALLDEAEQHLKSYPTESVGCVFVDRKGLALRTLTHDAQPHFGSVGGSWPRTTGSR